MKKFLGLSLIELMIALMIVGVLTAFALPSYSRHLVYAKRVEAEVMLMRLASALEQFYADGNSYAGASLEKLSFPHEIAKGSYRLLISEMSASRYVITAEPLLQQAKSDSECGVLGLDSVGDKKISGTGTVEGCW